MERLRTEIRNTFGSLREKGYKQFKPNSRETPLKNRDPWFKGWQDCEHACMMIFRSMFYTEGETVLSEN